MFLSSISLSPIGGSFEIVTAVDDRGARAQRARLQSVAPLAQPLLREIRDRLVIVRRHEARARVDVDWREPVDDLLAQAQNRQVSLLERLLVGGELHPAVLEHLDDLRARVEAD